MLADVAAMYYLRQMTQEEIARAVGVSRVKVHRLLKEAREARVVEITIHWSRPRDSQLEVAFAHHFGLRDALVLRTSGLDEPAVLKGIGEIGARYLEGLVKNNSTIAVCLGRSTYQVVQAVSSGLRLRVRVAQALGSIPFATPELDSATLARELAERLGGDVLYLPSPMLSDSPEATEVLRRQPDIERTLNAAATADVALVGIGNLEPAHWRLAVIAGLTPEALAEMVATGAVGDIAGQIFTIQGHLHRNALTDRIIGLSLDELRRIHTVFAVAFGFVKARAILGALRSGVVDVLCTDDRAAGEVLRIAGNAV
jgi:DNA-binding transcriptional regulator LsrR (DeoR family)